MKIKPLPKKDKNILKKLKTQALGIIASNNSDFDYQASNALKAILYPNSRLATPSIGTPESIAQIELGDIKEFIENSFAAEERNGIIATTKNSETDIILEYYTAGAVNLENEKIFLL